MTPHQPIATELESIQSRIVAEGLQSEFATVGSVQLLVLSDSILFCDHDAFPMARPVGVELAAVLIATA
jgi:hypothetical protein